MTNAISLLWDVLAVNQLSYQIPAKLFSMSSTELRVCTYEPLETFLFFGGKGVGFDRP